MSIQDKPLSPWRSVFDRVRLACGGKRDEHGAVGSINWLRKQMALNGANPNVVRNIIYRDKGRLEDKRVLFDILNSLWREAGHEPLQAPELEVLLSAGGAAEQEIAQLLGRDKRRAYKRFVSAVRSGEHSKLLVTGRPGSGKTVLIDYVQQALEMPPRAAQRIIRLEFSQPELGASLARLADALSIPEAVFEARLVKIGLASAFAVQADAQADVARLLVDGVRRLGVNVVLLLHLSRSLAGQDTLGSAQLRLSTEEVPRVNAAVWLWLSLLEPLSRMERVSLLVTMADVPARVLSSLGAFEGPLKLALPSVGEAKRFVRGKLPHLSAKLQDEIVRQAGRSFEGLRILTLLAELRQPDPRLEDMESLEERIELLSKLVDLAGDPALRDFLGALAVLSLPELPHFSAAALEALGQEGWKEPSSLARAFLDPLPGGRGEWRCFSRQLGRVLRKRLAEHDPLRYKSLHLSASRFYEREALEKPSGEVATRYLQHLFEARQWTSLRGWMGRFNVRQSLIRRIWQAATAELEGTELEAVALQVARYYVRLVSYDHPEARATFALLSCSQTPELRAWTQLKRAEGAIYKGQYELAEALLAPWPEVGDPRLRADYALSRANIARWRGQLAKAAGFIESAKPLLNELGSEDLLRAKVAVWSGLVAKDQGELEEALLHFDELLSDDVLVRARQAFQKGDVLAKLGRFGAALNELNLAVNLAREGEAPCQEEARYLARRGRVLRKRGETTRAEEDFERALTALERGQLPALERAFERAKVHDERALNLLAMGQANEAILRLQDNLDVFAHYGRECRVEAGFRILRSKLRLSLAYWARGSGQAYAMPLLNSGEGLYSADLDHARTLAESVRLATDPRRGERYGPLYLRALLVASLLADSSQRALRSAEEALSLSRYPYEKALSGAYRAAAKLRLGRTDEVLEASCEAKSAYELSRSGISSERGDAGLLAWLYALDIKASRGSRGAADSLSAALDGPELAGYREALVRAFGEAVEGALDSEAWLSHPIGRILRVDLNSLSGRSVRLPDELVARWRRAEA